MSWIQTFTARAIDPWSLTKDDIAIEDIAHALSMQCRFGGHCEEFYSVAQHSVHVAEVVADWLDEPSLAFEALLHDATEAYLLDLPRPIKHTPQLAGYRAVYKRVDTIMRQRFRLAPVPSPAVRRADEIMLATEAEQLMKSAPVPWVLGEKAIAKTIPAWSPKTAEAEFLAMFEDLQRGAK